MDFAQATLSGRPQ